MKKFKLFTAVVALAFLSFSFTEITPTETKKELHEQIVKLLGKTTDKLSDTEINAEVTFTLNDESEIVVVSVKSENARIDKYVKGKLNYQKVAVKALNTGKMYRIPLTIVNE